MSFSRITVFFARLAPLAGPAIAVLIFIFHMTSATNFAVGGSYLVAILVAGRFAPTRGVALTASLCAGFLLVAMFFGVENPISATIRICVLGIGTFLVVKAQSAEDAVRRSGAEWRELFQNSQVMYFMLDARGTILSVNVSAAAELGYQAEELLGRKYLELCQEPDRERVGANLDLCREMLDRPNTWEAQKTRKDGASFWVRESAKAIRRSNGDVVVLIASEDMTERRRADDAVRENAKRFRALIEHAFDVVLLLDRDLSVLYASPSVERVFGYAPNELVGRDALDFVHPDQVEDEGKLAAQALDRPGSLYKTERLLRHKLGYWLWTENSVTNLVDEPAVRAFVVNLRDIDARKRAEDALRESEQRFRDYAETASDWFWESGPDHRFTSFSHSAPFFGSGIGLTRRELSADFDEDPEKWRAHRATLDAHQPFRAFTYKITRPDGSTADVSVSGRPLFDQHARFQGYRGVASDVSDKVRADAAERALQDARMQLAHISRVTSLGVLTASIAHEVNQPLTALITNAGTGLRWLHAEPPNLEEARSLFSSIVKHGRRASDVVGRIRALAKKDPVLMDRLDINDTIRETVELARGEIARSRVALHIKLADPVPPIVGDRVQLQQVVLNLILNAIEAMGEAEPRELSIETRQSEDAIVVSVRDSGAGLDPANLDRIFEAFYSTKPGGMGIGLSICRSIIEAHSGTIVARPNEGRGSTLAFAIPTTAERAAAE